MKRLLLILLVWQTRSFFTSRGAAQFLNSLPPERAIEAKVICELGGPWYVVYRSEMDVNVPTPEEK